MNLFIEPLSELSEYESIRKNLKDGMGPVFVEGCVDAQKVHWMASFSESYAYKLIVTHSEKRVKEIYENYRFFDKNIMVYQQGILFFRVRMCMVRRWSNSVFPPLKNV